MNRLASIPMKAALRPAANFARRFIKNSVEIDHALLDRESYNQQIQRNIVNQYALFLQTKTVPYQSIKDAGFRVYSQFEEDGIILYVLSMIGFKTRRVVEMCCGSGSECMATNLVLNHGFDGYLFDGSDANIANAKNFFASKHDCLLYPPVLKQAWITAESVNDLLTDSGCSGEVDVLSLDLDGNQYWILKAITVINPRLIIVETNNIIPKELSVTIPYRPDFDYRAQAEHDFRGVSHLAMVKLCRQIGYRMIGAHRHGFNVFFLRNDEGVEFFPEVSIESVHNNHWSRWGQANRWPKVKNLPWQHV
jgi:hypothetical protein